MAQLIVGALVGLGTPALAWANPSDHVALELDAPADCPERDALRTRLDAQLGSDFETDTQLQASLRVRKLGPSDFELLLRYQTSSGASDTRQLRGESCAAVTDTAALLLALALNPRAALAAEPAAPQPSASESESEREERRGRARSSQALAAPRLGLLGVFDSAIMPRVTVGAGLLLGLRLGPIELRARGMLFLPREVALSDTTTTFAAWSVDLGVCTHWQVGWLQLGPCARAEVGSLTGSVVADGRDSTPDSARVQALGLGADLRAALAPPLWLALQVDFTWTTRSPPFEIAELGVVGRPARFGLRACLGPLLVW